MLHRGYNLTNHDANFQDICSAVTRSGIVAFVSVSSDGVIKEACCTYVLTPYRNLTNRSAPCGLDLLGFHGKKIHRQNSMTGKSIRDTLSYREPLLC